MSQNIKDSNTLNILTHKNLNLYTLVNIIMENKCIKIFKDNQLYLKKVM